jgi:hypothetical protein
MSTGLKIVNSANQVVIDTAGRSLFVISRFSIGAGTGWWDYWLPEWARYMTPGWTLTKTSSSGEVPYVGVSYDNGLARLTFSPSSANCSVTVFGW